MVLLDGIVEYLLGLRAALRQHQRIHQEASRDAVIGLRLHKRFEFGHGGVVIPLPDQEKRVQMFPAWQ